MTLVTVAIIDDSGCGWIQAVQVAPRLGLQIVRAFRAKRRGFRLCRERGRGCNVCWLVGNESAPVVSVIAVGGVVSVSGGGASVGDDAGSYTPQIRSMNWRPGECSTTRGLHAGQ